MTYHLRLKNVGKRFNREWIFRNCDYTFQTGMSYAITGHNGSGKSTLLQTIAGAINPSEGEVSLIVEHEPFTDGAAVGERSTVHAQHLYKHLSIAAPYLELVEEMTATEMLKFHASFKPLLPNISIAEILQLIGLEKAANKQIRFYSSGMKQRIKLAQAIFSDVPILLLDEPCTNFDAIGYALYHQLIHDYCQEKLLIVCSNDEQEYGFCKEKMLLLRAVVHHNSDSVKNIIS
ncbi:ATP-binding cassette domain-containing protein [Parasediminibacterium sp. JCM 36343]|uniref:ABC transporter ATP-binding protein n=1 Tax=Parasediminibacterium sp. JCM 36343 TaxID=3374279 RepID=UPI00397D8C40